jgi:hypothetical protein
VNLAWSVARVAHASGEMLAYRDSVRRIGTGGEAFVALGGWSRGILFGHALALPLYGPHWIDVADWMGERGEARQREADRAVRAALDARRTLWLLDPEGPAGLALERAGYAVERVGALRRAAPRLQDPGRVP